MKDIMAAFGKAEKAKKPPIEEMFIDVYDEKPERLSQQYDDLLEHIKKYPNEYPTSDYKWMEYYWSLGLVGDNLR